MLPLTTGFCQGFGHKVYKNGKVVSSLPWFNLCRQHLQPRDQGTWPCGNGFAKATVYTEKAYDGGGCLRLQYTPAGVQATEDKPYFRLFGCDLPLMALVVSYTFDGSWLTLSTSDIELILVVRSVTGNRERICLSMIASVPDKKRYAVTRDLTGEQAEINDWITRKYEVRDLSDRPGATLVEIGVGFTSASANSCLLGQVDVRRPSVHKDGIDKLGVDEEGGNEGLDDASLDILFDEYCEPLEKRMRS